MYIRVRLSFRALIHIMGLLAVLCWGVNGAAQTLPNIVVVFVDDFGWGDVACYGGAGVPTPHIDRLAHSGVQFRQFYVASPICSASRCGLITGQYPGRWRIFSYLQTRAGNRECKQADFLDPLAPNYVRAFKQAGYSTQHVGKWHLGGGRDVSDAPGFSAYGYDQGLGTYESPEPAAALGLRTVPWANAREPQQVPRHERTAWMVDQTLAIAERTVGHPWLVNLWLDDTHTPFRPSPQQLEAAGSGAGTIEYRAVLTETDRQIGRLVEGLARLNQLSNTLIILAGDNGPEPSFDRRRTGGLRGMKWSLYEGGIRTPLVVSWPSVIPAGVVNEETVLSAVDLFPSLMSLVGLSAPAEIVFDGEDLSAALRGKKVERSQPLFWEYGRKLAPNGQAGLRGFPYPSEPNSKSPNVAMRDGDWKLLVDLEGATAEEARVELYNLALDRNESKNLAMVEAERARQMSQQAIAWRRQLP